MKDLFARENRRRLTLKSGKERLISNRHPWIFAGAIAKESGPQDAAIADLLDNRGERVASGLHSLHSQIRMRALTFGDEELTADTIRARIQTAVRRRETNAARLINGEGDELSALIVDRYNDVLVVEIANSGLDQLRDLVLDTLRIAGTRVIYVKNDIPVRKIEQLPLEPQVIGDGEPSTTIEENGLKFFVDAREGQKTG